MKLFFAIPFVLLAACSASPTPKGVGFDGAQGAPAARTETVTYGQTFQRGSGQKRAPGLYRTPTGAPWYIVESRNVRQGKSPLQGFPAMDTASRYASSKWRAPHATPVTTASGSGMYRLVTVDGVSFVVMRKLKTKSFWSQPQEELAGIADGAVRAAGCTRSGNTVVRMANYSVQWTATPVTCAWL